MLASLVLTVIGPDRPGIVESIAGTLAAHGGNWEQSQMAHLAGQFAGILRISVDAARLPELRHALEGLARSGLRVVSETCTELQRPLARTLRLELTGADRQGIVHEIARALASRDINIEELTTSFESAPMSGEGLFHANALLRVPARVNDRELQHALEDIADDLMVDISLRTPEPAA
jgi:glycine cleavage system regulatory protein